MCVRLRAMDSKSSRPNLLPPERSLVTVVDVKNSLPEPSLA